MSAVIVQVFVLKNICLHIVHLKTEPEVAAGKQVSLEGYCGWLMLACHRLTNKQEFPDFDT